MALNIREQTMILISFVFLTVGIIALSSIYLNDGIKKIILGIVGMVFVFAPTIYWVERATSHNSG